MIWQEGYDFGDAEFDPERELELRLVAQAHAGAGWAVAALVARYQPPVVRHLVRLTGDPELAHALAEQVFVRMGRRLRGPHGREHVRLWLLRAATEAGLDAVRHPERPAIPRLEGPERPAAYLSGPAESTSEALASPGREAWERHAGSRPPGGRELVWQPGEAIGRAGAHSGGVALDPEDRISPRQAVRNRVVRAVLAELPYGDALCVALHLLAGLSHEEVARALGVAPAAVRHRVVRGLQLFGKRYEATVASLGLKLDEAAERLPEPAEAPAIAEPVVVVPATVAAGWVAADAAPAAGGRAERPAVPVAASTGGPRDPLGGAAPGGSQPAPAVAAGAPAGGRPALAPVHDETRGHGRARAEGDRRDEERAGALSAARGGHGTASDDDAAALDAVADADTIALPLAALRTAAESGAADAPPPSQPGAPGEPGDARAADRPDAPSAAAALAGDVMEVAARAATPTPEPEATITTVGEADAAGAASVGSGADASGATGGGADPERPDPPAGAARPGPAAGEVAPSGPAAPERAEVEALAAAAAAGMATSQAEPPAHEAPGAMPASEPPAVGDPGAMPASEPAVVAGAAITSPEAPRAEVAKGVERAEVAAVGAPLSEPPRPEPADPSPHAPPDRPEAGATDATDGPGGVAGAGAGATGAGRGTADEEDGDDYVLVVEPEPTAPDEAVSRAQAARRRRVLSADGEAEDPGDTGYFLTIR